MLQLYADRKPIQICFGLFDTFLFLKNDGVFHETELEFGTSEWCRYALSFHLQTGRCSEGFEGQLVAGLWNRDADFHSIQNQIGALDGSENSRSANTKPAEQLRRGQLKGLMHKHFFQPSHISCNVMDHWFDPKREESPKLDKIFERTIANDLIPSDRKTDYVMQKFAIGGYMKIDLARTG